MKIIFSLFFTAVILSFSNLALADTSPGQCPKGDIGCTSGRGNTTAFTAGTTALGAAANGSQVSFCQACETLPINLMDDSNVQKDVKARTETSSDGKKNK